MPAAPVATLARLGPRPAPARRLVCFPYAGGGVAVYGQWWRALPDDVEVIGVQLPGREARLSEAPLDSIDGMAGAALPAVAALGDLPFAFFGHSMGALIAFELTLALEAAGGAAPERLFVSSRRAPDERDTHLPVHTLPDAAFLDAIQARFAAIPDAVRNEPELLELVLPTLRADIRAVETYAPERGRRVYCPVRAYGGASDTHPRPSQLAGWQRAALQPLSVRTFDGDHFYLTPQRTPLLADLVAHWPRTTGAGCR
ncbi:MAG: thioesterase [Gemmatimonadaceae bacterium]|nr:thioesterase [Gemmatimonadaceae bacterium]